MTNLARSKLVRRRRAALIIVTIALLIAGATWIWSDANRAPADTLERAGSADVVAPIGQLHLISAMEPGELPGAPNTAVGTDPASIPDTRIQVDVAVKLEEMGLPVEPLDITVDDRLVTLEGRVEDTLLRDAIEVTVRSVEGVRQVDNRLEVVGGK